MVRDCKNVWPKNICEPWFTKAIFPKSEWNSPSTGPWNFCGSSGQKRYATAIWPFGQLFLLSHARPITASETRSTTTRYLPLNCCSLGFLLHLNLPRYSNLFRHCPCPRIFTSCKTKTPKTGKLISRIYDNQFLNKLKPITNMLQIKLKSRKCCHLTIKKLTKQHWRAYTEDQCLTFALFGKLWLFCLKPSLTTKSIFA